MNRFKAVIFDMDGLMIDSMLYCIQDDHEFYGSRGVEVNEELIEFVNGRTLRENFKWLKEKYNVKDSVNEMIQERRAQTQDIYTELSQPMPGINSLMKVIGDSPMKQALASASPVDRIKIILDRFNWHDYFDEVTSAEHVNHVGKPNPSIFLHAAKK